MLPVAATGVRNTIKNDETRPSDGANVEGVRRCLRERSFVPRVVVYHERLAVPSDMYDVYTVFVFFRPV